jgi:hypothetical protein
MRTLLIVIASALVLGATVSTAAQNNKDELQRFSEAHRLKAAEVDLPSGAGAWSVRVIRTGGFTGRLHDVAVTSMGKVQCLLSGGPCAAGLTGVPLQTLRDLVVPPVIPEAKSSISTTCKDCMITRVTIKRREANGKVKTYFAYWDDVTAGRTPGEFARIAQAAVALSDGALAR